MLSMILDGVSWVMLLIGSGFIITGGIGALRLPDLYTRMHATGLTDSMATLLILGGLMLQSGLTLATVKIFAILVFLMLTGPTASYALANAAFLSGLKPELTSEDNKTD